MSINYKNVVSVQTGTTSSASGYTSATAGGTPANIIKHRIEDILKHVFYAHINA